MTTIYDFKGQIAVSDGTGEVADIPTLLLQKIPNANKVRKATLEEDKSGIDYIVTLISGREVTVDLKVRTEDWAKKKGKDDLALEIWSVLEKKVGWTRDPQKQTDFILFFWKDTQRFSLVSFLMLFHVFTQNFQQWVNLYETAIQNSRGAYGSRWQSQCVYVPRTVVHNAIYHTFGGLPTTVEQAYTQQKKSRKRTHLAQPSIWEISA